MNMANARKYVDIVEWTMEQINAGAFQPGDRFLSESALCMRFACSRQTVRRALEVLEQEGYISRFQGSGTYISSARTRPPKRSAAGGELSMTVGMISNYMDNCFFPSIMRGIEGVLSEKGFALELVTTNNQVAGETRALQFMLGRQLDGLIVEPTRSALPCANTALYHEIARKGTPIVFIDSFYPELSIPYVALDDEKAGYVATRYLLEMGHRRILGVFPHSHRQGHLRYLGYAKAHTEHGITFQDELVYWHSRESIDQMLHSEQFTGQISKSTAVLCHNDHTAMLIVDFLRQNGKKVPDDLSVVGIDNSELAKFCSLTSIAHPQEQMGETAARMLLSMINGSEGKNVLLPPELVVRNSVRKCGN